MYENRSGFPPTVSCFKQKRLAGCQLHVHSCCEVSMVTEETRLQFINDAYSNFRLLWDMSAWMHGVLDVMGMGFSNFLI